MHASLDMQCWSTSCSDRLQASIEVRLVEQMIVHCTTQAGFVSTAVAEQPYWYCQCTRCMYTVYKVTVVMVLCIIVPLTQY